MAGSGHSHVCVLYIAETAGSEEFHCNSFPLDEIQKENQDLKITHFYSSMLTKYLMCWKTVALWYSTTVSTVAAEQE